MELAATCRYCGGRNGCCCRTALDRFFAILQCVDQRVSTPQLTSVNTTQFPDSVLIDKLSFELPSPISEFELKARARASSLPLQLVKLRDKRFYFQIGGEDSGLYFRRWLNPSPNTNQLISRPSAMPSFELYKKQLALIFTQEELNNLRITRADFAIDYPIELSQLQRGFDVDRKQCEASFNDRSGNRTGIRIGKGNEKFIVYDKALEAKLKGPRTRIEVQLSGKKLPARDLARFEKTLSAGIWNPFNGVILNHVAVSPRESVLSEQRRERIIEMAAILDREGLFSVRRLFNQNGNFTRDYKPFIQLTPWGEQPAQSFKKHFLNFNSKPEKEIEHGHL